METGGDRPILWAECQREHRVQCIKRAAVSRLQGRKYASTCLTNVELCVQQLVKIPAHLYF